MADSTNFEIFTPKGLATELGRRLARVRLARNVTQKTLAREAGIGLRTLRRLETGQSPTLDSFLRIAIALGLADDLLSAIPSHEIRPIERVDSPRRSERKRARPASTRGGDEPWSWGDEPHD
ncbi:helix-turn-helix domain-containing protein [Candidatus Rariloculus sp.]|uniref:helix-turn-helix domain-containing protein n=1 Tax=Candidatus Rariloculus sp. TaxID=3101265 RepID=UPI003D14C257